MLEKQAKLKKEVGELYYFANVMYGNAMDNLCKRKSKKPKSFEEERLLEYVQKEITKSIQSYFKDLKIDEKLFKDFNKKQKEHLISLSKSIDEVEKLAADDILEEFFTPKSEEKALENAVEKVISSKNNSIENINRQIGYSMVLYGYENKGYRKYRFKPSDTACEECKERGRHTYYIEKLKDVKVHPNCRCTLEILDDKNNGVATIDSKAIEEHLENTEATKGMGFLDYVSALLSAAALIPGIDSFVDLVSIPVDLLRGDFRSAGFDLLGILPLVGEVGDAGKALRIADKASDAAEFANKSSKGTELLNQVSNSKLRNTIKEMYLPGGKVGDGGLADAIRHEVKTGNLVGGKSHIQKGIERLKNLERISKRETLTKQEIKIVEDLIKDLKSALGGK